MPAKTAPVAATHVREKTTGRSGPCPRFVVASSAGDNAGSGNSFVEIPRRLRFVGMAPSPAVIPSVSEESAVGNTAGNGWTFGRDPSSLALRRDDSLKFEIANWVVPETFSLSTWTPDQCPG